MTTDTITRPRRALVEPEAPTSLLHHDPRTADASPTRPRRRRPSGAARILRALLVEGNRRPTRDPLMLLGPNGGPLWATHLR